MAEPPQVYVGGTWDAEEGEFVGGTRIPEQYVTFDEETGEWVVTGSQVTGNLHIIAEVESNLLSLSWDVENGYIAITNNVVFEPEWQISIGYISRFTTESDEIAKLPQRNEEFIFRLGAEADYAILLFPFVRIGGNWDPVAEEFVGPYTIVPVMWAWDGATSNIWWTIAAEYLTGNVHIEAVAESSIALPGRLITIQNALTYSTDRGAGFMYFRRRTLPNVQEVPVRVVVRNAPGNYVVHLPIGTYDIEIFKRGYLDHTIREMEVYEYKERVRDIAIIGGNASWDRTVISFLDIVTISGGWATAATPLARERANIAQNPTTDAIPIGRPNMDVDMATAIWNYGARSLFEGTQYYDDLPNGSL